MKLKFLFFPLSLILLTVFSIWFIWPAWFNEEDGINGLKEIANEKGNLLEMVGQKKSKIASLENSLSTNPEQVEAISSYLSSEEEKEEIINGLNHLAVSAGLSLIQVELESLNAKNVKNLGQGVSSNDEEKIAVKIMPEKTGIEIKKTISADKKIGNSSSDIEEFSLELIAARTVVSGEYENIKNFLDQIYRMEIMNNIYSINISKETIEETGVAGEENAASVSTNKALLMKVDIYFGYMPTYKVVAGKSLDDFYFEIDKFNLGIAEKINERIVSGIPEIEVGETKTKNPFSL